MDLDRRIFLAEFAFAAALGFLSVLTYYVYQVWWIQTMIANGGPVPGIAVYGGEALAIVGFLLDPVLLALVMFRIGRGFDLPNGYRRAIASLILGYILGKLVGTGAGIPQILFVLLNPTSTVGPSVNVFVTFTLASNLASLFLAAASAFVFSFGALAIGYFYQLQRTSPVAGASVGDERPGSDLQT